MSVITRDEYKTYTRIKKKLSIKDQETQTEQSGEKIKPVIIFQRPPTSDDDDDEDYDDECESDSEDEDAENKQELKRKLRSKTKRSYGYDDIKYYKKLDNKRQKIVDEVEEMLLKVNDGSIPLRFKIIESEMDIKLKALAISKVDQLGMLDASSSEYYKLSNWIEHICKIPIGRYKQLPVSSGDSVENISTFLEQTKSKLDEVVYGHGDAKDQIVRLLAKWISNPTSKGLVIGIEGVHGIGKTSLVKDGICKVLDLPFGFITLGGISDGSFMVGHSYTYEGSRWGKIADILMKVQCMNPVLYFDELDKISTTTHGEEIANLLIHLTDASQNDHFQDKYFTDLNLDLSRCLIIFSYNHADMINPILKDRMTIIKANGYNTKDKKIIARDYMLPKICQEFAFAPSDLVFSDECLAYVIDKTDEEQGVRNLKRSLEELVSQVNLARLLRKTLGNKDVTLPFHVTKDIVDMFISKKKDENISLPMMYI